jgi:rod shape determining protein RodA
VIFLGKEVSGSRSWISLGPVALQPSEFVKISLILIIARFYHNDFEDGPFGITDLVKPVTLTLILFFLVLLQPDLGTSIMIVLISGSMFLFMGIRKKALLMIFVSLIVLAVPAWNFFLKDYQKDRILTFVDPSVDPLGTGYNSIQSQIAVGSGKLTGKGFMSGTQTQLRFIPAQKTDFAFSVLAEEWGFIGSAATLLIYFLLIIYMLDTASSAKDKFSMLTAFGVASLFFWHTLINIGMVLGLLPVVGVPLLLFSYGGSSVLTSLIAIGIVLGIKMRQKPVPKEQISL